MDNIEKSEFENGDFYCGNCGVLVLSPKLDKHKLCLKCFNDKFFEQLIDDSEEPESEKDG